ncbi:MAG: DUF4124 domain-containing protein [Gammaproteobacteria bacterium]
MYAILAVLALALGSADVYRWVDAEGVTHFSDQPHAGAERVTITVSKPARSATDSAGVRRSSTNTDQHPVTVGYQSLVVTKPTQDQVLWNIEGQLDVAATVQPALRSGHAMVFTLDGRTQKAEQGASTSHFTGVYRGEHSLTVDVVDASGKALMSSATIRFNVRQTSIANPVRPTTPLPPRP